MLCFFKDKGECIPEGLMGSQPDKFVGSRFDGALKGFLVGVANLGVESVTGDNQIGVGEAIVNVTEFKFLLEVKFYAEFLRTSV